MKFDEWYDRFRDRVTGSKEIDQAALAEEYARQVIRWAYDEAKDEVAAEHVYNMVLDSARRRVKSWHQNANTVRVKYKGRQQRKHGSYATPVVDPDSAEITGHRYVITWDMTWEAFLWYWRGVTSRYQSAKEAKLKADAIKTAWEARPHCRTAREAWTAAGHSVDEIDLDEIFGAA